MIAKYLKIIIKKISFFIGSTASIIECLERNISAIHICSDEILDLYHPRFWKPLSVKKLSGVRI